ncbi:MAG: GGDEF domain-containing protein [Lachnospiraceae bacterium]|nr:GGDEF domain-containing protein [Lachnospiraceae bacterium]
MKKKIAVFGNGWSEEFLKQVLAGIQNRAADNNIDIYAFFNYSSGPNETLDNNGEKVMFTLPDITMFDGVIVLGNTINIASEREYLRTQIIEHNIPAVSLEYQLEGIPCLGTDTYSGVYELTSHIIKEHNVKKIIYFSGPADNQENQSRLQAVNDALAHIGEKVSPEDILYGQWSYYDAMTCLEEWLKTNPLPDAFVCANDEMALGVCTTLDNLNIRVPEQVIVTGCDCIDLGQKIYPILSTVARSCDKLGYDAMDCVLRQIDGEQIAGTTIYNTSPVYGESCGCKVSDERIQNRRRSIISQHKQQKENTIYEWHLRSIDDMLAKVTSIREAKDHLGWQFAYSHNYESEHLLICLVDSFIENDFHKDFTPEMEEYLHLEYGQSQPCGSFPSKNLLPKLNLPKDGSNTYLFLPLHITNNILGYVVFINRLDIIFHPDAMYMWTRHISQDIDRVRQNVRMKELNKMLTEVSMTDALTGLKNRAGYDSLAVPYLQKCQREGKLGTMIFADINRMKLINDKYGHLQGDYALCTVAEAIKRTMPQDWIAVRFGGDEFIMVGECSSLEEAEHLKQALSVNLNLIKKERDLCFPLTASFGAVVMNPDENYSLEEYLRKADEAMYVMKQKAHAED